MLHLWHFFFNNFYGLKNNLPVACLITKIYGNEVWKLPVQATISTKDSSVEALITGIMNLWLWHLTIALNSVPHSYVICLKWWICIMDFQWVGLENVLRRIFGTRVEESTWKPEILWKISVSHLMFYVYFFTCRCMCSFRRNDEKTQHRAKMDIG